MLRCTSARRHLDMHSALKPTSKISQLTKLLELGERPCTSAIGSCFAIAIENCNWNKVKLLLDHTPTGVNISAGYKHVTALMKFGHIPDATQYLLRIGADVNAEDRNGDCALSHVIRHKKTNPAAVRMLIDAGANVNTKGMQNMSIMNQFLQRHKNFDVQIFTMLLTAGAKIDVAALRHIISQNQVNLEIVKALTEAPPDVNVQNSNKNKILILAAKNQKIDIVKLMIKSGADVNFQEVDSKYSALMFAVKSPDVEMVKTLIEAGADVNFQDKNGCSVLMHAIKCRAKNLVRVVNMLLEKQADLCVKDKDGNNTLMYAVKCSKHALSLVETLLKSGARVNDRNNYGESALILAARKPIINPQVVEILINAHADVNVQNSDGDSALMLAVMNRNVTLEVVSKLTSARANVLAENDARQTALSAAISSCKWHKNRKEIVLILDHLLQLPELKDAVYAPHTNHPQPVLLKTVCIDVTYFLDEAFFKIFKLIINSQFKDTVYLEPSSLVNVPVLFQDINIPCGAVALLLNKWLYSRHVFAVKKYVKVLLDAGFNMREGVSPLTIFLMNVNYRIYEIVQITEAAEQAQNAKSNSVSQFIAFLIEHGAHVGQQMLRLHQTYIGLQDLRAQLYVPDALLAALKTKNMRAVRQLLPYWGFPGLYLLLFTSKYGDTNYLYRLFPVLIEHGGVPQGTELYSKLRQHLALNAVASSLYLETFEQMHSSLLSLRELCRYQVRASLAAQASHAGHNLPALVRELSPPGLKDFLLMQPPADLGLLVCDNPLLVEASKQAGFYSYYEYRDLCDSDSQTDEVDYEI